MAETQQITDSVLRQVEQVTGVPVVVEPDPSLKLLAKMKMARAGASVHVISYNPSTANADYAICYQCGFILRSWAIPEAQKFDVATTYWGRKEAEGMVTTLMRSSGKSLPKEVKLSFRDQVYNGLILQLRSVPVGLRVDAWLNREHAGLAEQQRAMISRQLQDNTTVLGSEIRKISPPKIYAANVAMTSAFAAYWSRLWSEPMLMTPYTISGHAPAGQELLKIFNEIPDDPAQDRELIAAWSRSLGLQRWIEFVPFRG